MNKKIVYLIIGIALVISAFSLFQNSQIRRLKEIQDRYEMLTQNFVELQSTYDVTLEKYKVIKHILDQSTVNLDSLRGELDVLNQENRLLLDSLNKEITGIIHTIDTTVQDFDFFDWRDTENNN